MALFFRRRDGRWSEQTKTALQRHNAKGLDLNQNWALVEQTWTCPICKRSKNEIFRLSTRGILLAKLEEHHDHLRDFVRKRARDLYGEKWLADVPRGGHDLADQLEHLVSSFTPELVCSECNAADGKAKAHLKGKVHTYFSFSPSEIAQFITPKPNAPHGIDLRKVEDAWDRARPKLEMRLKLIDDTLSLIQSGMLRQEHGTPWFRVAQRQFDPHTQLYQAFLSETNRDERERELSRMLNEFLARSVQKDSPVIAPKTSSVAHKVRVPSDAEYAAYTDPVSARRWEATPEIWSCPVCQRSKRQLVRWSKTGNKWSGGVREHLEPIVETYETALWARRRLLPGFRNAFVMRDSKKVLICSGCQDVATQLKQRRRDIPDQFLTITDIRECLIAVEAHTDHQVDWDETANRALNNAAVGSAWDAYFKHRSMVWHSGEQYKRLARYVASPREVVRG
ncbi:hypothetical protein AB4097_21415 [Microvirga sp. 2MCAF35]|uniref:hypothetical protein n=1 Tax=Microvirga sp. 2MCAF35 TaxID=3232987 RepID=UPI003F9A182D